MNIISWFPSHLLLQPEQNSEETDENDDSRLGHCVKRDINKFQSPLRESNVDRSEKRRRRHFPDGRRHRQLDSLLARADAVENSYKRGHD